MSAWSSPPPGPTWFDAVLAHLEVGVLVIDAGGRVRYASAAAGRVTGVDPAEAIGREVFELIHPEDREFALIAFTNTISRPGPAVPLAVRIAPEHGGDVVDVRASNLLDDPTVRGVVVELWPHDRSTDVRTIPEASERRYRAMLENISDTVSLVDAERRVVAVTGNERPLGYPNDFWSSNSTRAVIHPDDRERYDTFLDELRASSGTVVRTQYRIRHADGHWVTQDVQSVNLLADDDVRAIVTTTRDITDQVAAAEALAAARDEALNALQARNELVASVSHELRTPIHGILGLTELLLAADLPHDETELVSSIRRATESLRLVLDDLLDFSKIEAGRLELIDEEFAVDDVARDLYALFGPMAASASLTFAVDVDPDVPRRVVGDPLRFRQVLHNLVGNAIKFTPQGEVRVTLRAAPLEDTDALRLVVSVSDTGIGIAGDDLRRVFEPFAQLSAGGRTPIRGTGLGLAIAQRLVRLLGGELEVASEPGVGSTFSFGAVVRAAPERSSGAPAAGANASGSEGAGARVLVVEDNPTSQLLVLRQLERLGLRAELAEDGLVAVERYRAGDHDVVLLDWQLPGLDGLEVARRLRAIEDATGRRRTPIIAVTASALADDERRARGAGMDAFLAKPVDLATLRAALDRVLAHRAEPGDRTDESPLEPVVEASPTRAPWTNPSPVVVDVGPSAGSGTPAPTEPEGRPVVAVDRRTVDRVVLEQLADELDDEVLLATVVRSFLRELPGRVLALREALGAGDTATVHRVAHTLGSTSAAVGAHELAESSRTLEQVTADEVAGTTLAGLVATLTAVAERTQAALPVVLAEVVGET